VDFARRRDERDVEEGARAYIERINIRGNTRTRDYVIRREFDLGEGDAYNRALVDRAERRLKNLNFFKAVKITNEPGSAPDRVVINVDVEEQATGEFSVSGGYSTADGFIAEVSVADRVDHFGQGLRDGVLRVIDVLKGMLERVGQSFHCCLQEGCKRETLKFELGSSPCAHVLSLWVQPNPTIHR
jgi:hypothetical protein